MHRNKIDMPRTKRLTRRAFALYAALVLVCCAATPVLAEAAGLREESRLCSLGVLVSTVLSVVTIPLLYALTAWLGA